jgi:hypothetical protein
MPVTLSNYMEYMIPLRLREVEVPCFVFNGASLDDARNLIQSAQNSFQRLPNLHLSGIYPFLMLARDLPSSGHGGGTPESADFISESHTARIGAGPDVVRRIVSQYANGRTRATFHWIPIHVWQESGRLPSTMVHEAVHGIDRNFELSTRRRVHAAEATRLEIQPDQARPFRTEDPDDPHRPADFPDPMPGTACWHGTPGVRVVVNAYCKLLDGFRGVSSDAVKKRIARNLSVSRAFLRVPSSWWDMHCPGMIPRE